MKAVVVFACLVFFASLLFAPWEGLQQRTLSVGGTLIETVIRFGPMWQAPSSLYGHQPHIRAAIPVSQRPRIHVPLLVGIWVCAGAAAWGARELARKPTSSADAKRR